MQNDLTTGSVFRNVVSFSLPYLLSYFLQTLYGMADLFIIGQFEGVASTTAVSIGSQVMHMLTVMLVGLAMGATVSIAQAAGGGDKKRTASAIGNTVTLFMLLSLALTALLLALRGSIVSIMSTPEEAVQGTLAYLTVCFIGIPFITAYNIIASIFRGLGDSQSPMYFIAVAPSAPAASSCSMRRMFSSKDPKRLTACSRRSMLILCSKCRTPQGDASPVVLSSVAVGISSTRPICSTHSAVRVTSSPPSVRREVHSVELTVP